jgi:hypothetical protein
MDIPFSQKYITTGVKMCTPLPRLVNASWTLSSSPPHNYQMPQLSSTNRLIVMAKDMTYALQNPHPDVPFTHVGDDTISAFTELTEIFKLKLRKNQTPTLPVAPPKVTLRTCLAESSNPIVASPMPPPRQTRSQTTIYPLDITNAPLLPRVVTPMTRNPSPPRVSTHSLA